jgi:hypothetical protein
MQGSKEIPPSRSANWLTEIMANARNRNACLTPNCTTCGALPFKKALWASAETASPGDAAQAIADQLAKLEPPIDVKGIQFGTRRGFYQVTFRRYLSPNAGARRRHPSEAERA